jgi:TetR/AcrR family transcriptional repressor of lmrAB and yxaGH operons
MTAAREQIVEATCALIEVQGYHATGLNQIISESGSPKGSLYHYFPGGKEALVTEALQRAGSAIEERIRAGLMDTDNPAEAVRRFLHGLAHHVAASDYQRGGPITTVALETASTSERLREACLAIYERWRVAFREKLTSGGVERQRAERLSMLILASIEGGIILSRTQRDSQLLRYIGDELARLIGSEG